MSNEPITTAKYAMTAPKYPKTPKRMAPPKVAKKIKIGDECEFPVDGKRVVFKVAKMAKVGNFMEVHSTCGKYGSKITKAKWRQQCRAMAYKRLKETGKPITKKATLDELLNDI